ncbi:glucosaminidase domain-containing protein [Myxococcota bacterium]|nr:glucosaminidase domain-containing protein [Myxococcota bacterium]
MVFRTEHRRAATAGLQRYLRTSCLFLFVLCYGAQGAAVNSERPPDFASMKNTKERKLAFFCYMAPLLETENALVAKERARLMRIHESQSQGGSIDESDRRLMGELASKYKVRSEGLDAELLEALLLHVDQVPISLALAQAANESAWGTSRFAREGNNYFGHWCFRKGCGIVPLERPDGASYEVRHFAGARQSVAAFISNLNTNAAYASFRTIRSNERSQGVVPSGLATAEGLEKYSARGVEYVKTLQSMIRYNRLKSFDEPKGTDSTCRDQRARTAETGEDSKSPA